MVTTVMPGTASPCRKRSTIIHWMSVTKNISAVGTARKNTEPTMMGLRPMASDSMPVKGAVSATASTVAPTVEPACTTLA